MATVIDLRAFVGIDYHDEVIQVCILDRSGKCVRSGRLPNHVPTLVEFIEDFLEGRTVAAVAIEACCGAANLADQLQRLGWNVHLAHPGTCSRMKQNPDKTDFQDAHLLADLIRVGYLPEVWLPPARIRDLRRLTRLRQQLVEERRRVKQRIRSILREERIVCPDEVGTEWTISWITWLKTTGVLGLHTRWVMDRQLESLEHVVAGIRQVEQRMKEATGDDPLVQRLLAQKGIGLVTAVTMRAEIGCFRRFCSGKQLARYCAV